MTDRPERRPSERGTRPRSPRRVGELLPAVASALGLEDELRMARAMASWERLVAERVPAAAGGTRLVEVGSGAIVVAAQEPIVAQELRLRAGELLEAFRTAPGGVRARELRVIVRRGERL